MLTKVPLLVAALSYLVIFSSCDPTYITQEHYFTNEYTITEINVPDYPFKGKKEPVPIRINFPKQGNFTLQLSTNQCGGKYKANVDGTLKITQTNCAAMCCDSEWDLFILTLILKAVRFEEGSNKALKLIINDNNYLLCETSA